MLVTRPLILLSFLCCSYPRKGRACLSFGHRKGEESGCFAPPKFRLSGFFKGIFHLSFRFFGQPFFFFVGSPGSEVVAYKGP